MMRGVLLLSASLAALSGGASGGAAYAQDLRALQARNPPPPPPGDPPRDQRARPLMATHPQKRALEDARRDLLAGQIEASNANERAATQLRLRELETQRAPPSLRGLTVPPPRVVEEQGRRDAELSASAGQLERLTQAALAESNARMRAIRPASEPKQR